MGEKENFENVAADLSNYPPEVTIQRLQALALAAANGEPFMARDILGSAYQSFPAYYSAAVNASIEREKEKEKKKAEPKKEGLPDVG